MTRTATIVHAADTHIDSPLRGLDRIGSEQLAHTLRAATRHAFSNLVDLVLDRKADALVLAGDIYDGDAKDYGTARFFTEQMIRLDDAGIPVVMVTGNHDADSVITRTLQVPRNVHVLPTDTPGSVQLADAGLAFHGQGFATKAVLSNLAQKYPEPVPGMINVGVLHTSVAGYEGHDPYAPCSVEDLKARSYEYFALGHIHQRQVLCTGRTTAAFSGNLQGRHVKETGAKGALVVTLRPGESAELEFVALDVARWEHLHIDASAAATRADLLSSLGDSMVLARREAGDRPVVARITLAGETALAAELADAEQLREDVTLLAGRFDVVVERIRNRTTYPAQAAGVGIDPAELQQHAGEGCSEAAITRLVAKVKSETDPILRELGLLEPLEPEQILAEARDALVARLAGGK